MTLLELVTGWVANEAGADANLAIWGHNFTELMAEQLEKLKSAVDNDIPDQARYMEDMEELMVVCQGRWECREA